MGPVPDTVLVVNPERRKLDSSIRKTTAQRNLCNAKFGALSLEKINMDLDKLKAGRKLTPKRIAIKDLSEDQRFDRLLPERKHFVDTIGARTGKRIQDDCLSCRDKHGACAPRETRP